MAIVDGRSVGELLLDCDLIVRDVLMDTAQMDGRVMVRTWGEVVEAAADLWQAFPAPTTSTGGPERQDAGQVLMLQLQTMNAALTKAARRRQWPGEGPADERLLRVCENLTTASELLPRRRTDVQPMRPQVRADLQAAKTRLMHVLYVGAHGVQVALNRDLRDLAVMPSKRRAALPARSQSSTAEARDRMAAFGQLAGSYLAGTFPAALRGEYTPAAEPDRLRQALASWDITAHRALVGTPTAATVVLIAQTQAHTAHASQTLLRAAAETGRLEPDQYRTRLAPALETLQASWVSLARTWSQLASPSERQDRDLVTAANELRAATLELVHDRTGGASVQTLAATVDVGQAAQTLQLGLATSTELAYAVRQATADPHLLAAARRVNTLAMTLEAHGPSGNVATKAWVRLEDHVHDRPVPLPDIVRDSLTRAANTAAHACTTAAGAAASLDAPGGGLPASTAGYGAGSRVHRGQRLHPIQTRSRSSPRPG